MNMTVDLSDQWPLRIICIDRPREVIFSYNGQEINRRVMDTGYWYYWIAGNGACCVKQFY